MLFLFAVVAVTGYFIAQAFAVRQLSRQGCLKGPASLPLLLSARCASNGWKARG